VTREPESGDPLAFRPLPHGLAYLLLGLLVALLALARVGMPLLMVAGLGVLGTLTVIGLAIVRGRQFDGADQISEAGVRGPTLFGPVFIPWSEVVRVGDDKNGVTVYSARRSARIDLAVLSVQRRPVPEHSDTEAVVRFILAHVPKHAIIELSYYVPV